MKTRILSILLMAMSLIAVAQRPVKSEMQKYESRKTRIKIARATTFVGAATSAYFIIGSERIQDKKIAAGSAVVFTATHLFFRQKKFNDKYQVEWDALQNSVKLTVRF